MCDVTTDNATSRLESESESGTYWDSLCNEEDSLRHLSEVSLLHVALSTDYCKENRYNDYIGIDDDKYDNDGKDQCCPNTDNLESCTSQMENKENEEVTDETLLPQKLQGKKWIVKKILGEGSFFRVSQAYADGILLAIRKRHFRDYNDVFTTKCRDEIEKEYWACRGHVTGVLSKIGHHDNIATFFGLRRVGLGWEMFVEYAGGGDLFDEITKYVKRRRRIPEEVVTSRFRDLTRAVAYLHRCKIAHLDIKIENCLLTKWGSLKLADFDSALIFTKDMRITSFRIGTKAYAPPQRFCPPIKPECADIWSCGIVLHALLSCRLPWSGAYRLVLS
uniref:non-specific serine/threonine protein kinase n=1 Tax=Setaria digitata TaxID=48799 RepID=A0A915PZ59_9BILA